MHIPEAAINRLADDVVHALVSSGFIKPKVAEKQLVARVVRLLLDNLRTEQELEQEAERAAQKLGRQALGMDQRKLMRGHQGPPRQRTGFYPVKFSEGRLSHLAHQILAIFRAEGLADIENERLSLQAIKRALEGESERDARLDEVVRRKIASLSRKVPQGSREWDILYRRYMEEEQRKQKS